MHSMPGASQAQEAISPPDLRLVLLLDGHLHVVLVKVVLELVEEVLVYLQCWSTRIYTAWI